MGSNQKLTFAGTEQALAPFLSSVLLSKLWKSGRLAPNVELEDLDGSNVTNGGVNSLQLWFVSSFIK